MDLQKYKFPTLELTIYAKNMEIRSDPCTFDHFDFQDPSFNWIGSRPSLGPF